MYNNVCFWSLCICPWYLHDLFSGNVVKLSCLMEMRCLWLMFLFSVSHSFILIYVFFCSPDWIIISDVIFSLQISSLFLSILFTYHHFFSVIFSPMITNKGRLLNVTALSLLLQCLCTLHREQISFFDRHMCWLPTTSATAVCKCEHLGKKLVLLLFCSSWEMCLFKTCYFVWKVNNICRC